MDVKKAEIGDVLLKVTGLKTYFKINENLTVKAVDGVTFSLKRGTFSASSARAARERALPPVPLCVSLTSRAISQAEPLNLAARISLKSARSV